jgi:elongation factor G
VDDETSTFDFEPQEQKRHSTINTSIAWLEWGNCKVNLLDTPGASDFLNDTRMAIEVADGALVLVGATDGVQVGTEKVWAFAEKSGIAAAVVITGMDKERGNLPRCGQRCSGNPDRRAVPVFLPIGKESAFKGIVNLIRNKAYLYEDGKVTEAPVPADMASDVAKSMEKLMEVVAEADAALTDKYLEEGELSPEDIQKAFPLAVRTGKLIPILCCSSKKLAGVDSILDFVNEFFPSPAQRKPFLAKEAANPRSGSAYPSSRTRDHVLHVRYRPISLFRDSRGIESDAPSTTPHSEKKRLRPLYVMRGKNATTEYLEPRHRRMAKLSPLSPAFLRDKNLNLVSRWALRSRSPF